MKTKGVLYAVIASMLLGTGFISVKYFTSHGINTETMNTFWFFFGAFFSFLISMVITKGQIFFMLRKYWKIELLLGLANWLNAIFWFKGMELLDPSVASFILRFVAVFTIILSFIFLKEKFTKMESLGVAVAMGGAFLITASGGNLVLKGVIFMLLAALFFAIHNILAKTVADDVDPMSLNTMRALFSFFVISVYTFSTGKVSMPPLQMLVFIALASSVTMVIGFWFFLRAIKEMEVSKVMVVRSIDPFFVILYSFIVFRTIPGPIEIIGGAIIVAGILIMIKAHEIHRHATRAFESLTALFE